MVHTYRTQRRVVASMLVMLLLASKVSLATAITYDSSTSEYFETIDDYGLASGSDTISLRFGSTLGEYLRFNQTSGKFVFTDDLDIQGTASGSALTIMGGNSYFLGKLGVGTSNVPETQLEVVGTISGSALRLTGGLSVSGSLAIEQNMTLSGSILQGFGLVDCDTGATSKLLWDSSTGRFSCGTDQTGGAGTPEVGTSSFSGGVLRLSDTRYVNTAGDTMTGTLVIQNGSTHSPTGTALMNVRGVMSGATVYGNDALRSSGSLVWEGSASGKTLFVSGNATFAEDLTFGDAIGDAITVNAGTWSFANATNFGVTNAANAFSIDTDTFSVDALNNRIGIRTTAPDNPLEVVGTISGSVVYSKDSFRSSGSLVWEGPGSGASLYIGGSLQGVGLADCDTGATSKLLWDSTTGRFSCGTDQTGGSTGGGGGWTDDGGVVRLDTAGDQVGIGTTTVDSGVKAEVIGTISGATIHASSRLASSGVLVLRAPGNAEPTIYANGTKKVGVNTASPHSSLTASGTFATSIRIATATGSINESDQIIFASGSSMITLTLPTAVGINGRQYTIKKTSASVGSNIRPVVIATTSSQKIDRLTGWRLTNRGQQVTVISDGANWQVIDSSSYGLNGGYTTVGTTMNQWYTSPSNGTATAAATFTTTATIRAFPFIAQKVMSINGMAVSVQTTAASSQVRVALYRDSGNGYPDTLIFDAGTVTTTTTGMRTICASGCTATNSTFPFHIQPGLYWLAVNNNSIAVTLRGFAVGGINPVLGFPSNYTTVRNFGWSIANTYTSFPSTFPAAAALVTAVPLPQIFMRILE